MQTNHWGPVPFVIAYALEKTPNYPDGNPAPKDCVFAFGGTGGRLPGVKRQSFGICAVAGDPDVLPAGFHE